MNPEQRKNHRGGARVQKPESPRREKETKREKKPGRPRTKKQKILLGLYIALTVVAAIIVAGAIVFGLMSAPPEVALPTPTPRHTTIINEQGEEVEVEIPGLSAGRKEQFYTFLVAGVSGGNTDTMLLAAYDVPNQKLSVMSLPRDTYVIYNGRTVMINSVYSRGGGEEGGVEALKKAVGSLTGVTPDFYVLVEWEAVGELVDAIGGVYFDVPRRMYYNDLSQHFKIDLQPGYQLLDGNGAMGVLRWRHNSDDSGHILNSGYAMGIPQGGRPQVPPARCAAEQPDGLYQYLPEECDHRSERGQSGLLRQVGHRQAGHGQRGVCHPAQPVRWGRPPAARGQPDCGDGQ